MTAVKRTKTSTRKKPLNIRRKKFVKNLVNGMGVGQSALRAGYADRSEGTALLRDPSVLSALQTAMVRAGIDDEYLSSKIKEGLEATYPEKRSKDGSVLQEAAPDFFTRGQYLDKAFKVRGDYAPDRHIEEKKILTINVNMDTLRGLKDCGILDAEILDGGNDGFKALPGRLGGDQEERGGVGSEAGQAEEQSDERGGVSAESQCGEGPGEAGASEASPSGVDV